MWAAFKILQLLSSPRKVLFGCPKPRKKMKFSGLIEVVFFDHPKEASRMAKEWYRPIRFNMQDVPPSPMIWCDQNWLSCCCFGRQRSAFFVYLCWRTRNPHEHLFNTCWFTYLLTRPFLSFACTYSSLETMHETRRINCSSLCSSESSFPHQRPPKQNSSRRSPEQHTCTRHPRTRWTLWSWTYRAASVIQCKFVSILMENKEKLSFTL